MNIEIHDYLVSLTDSDLLEKMETAKADLAAASESKPNSEWHQSCFAGAILLGEEVARRKITPHSLH